MSGHIFKLIIFAILVLLGLYLTIPCLCPNSDKVPVNFEQTSTPSREFDKKYLLHNSENLLESRLFRRI